MEGRVLAVCLLLVASCLEPAPPTRQGGACEDPESGGTCLTLRVTVDPDVRRRADGDLVGDLHWGLYEEGDVGPFGPGDSPSVAGGLVPDVDLSLSGSEAYIDIPDLPPGAYQVLTFLDDDGDGESSDGDPVSLPSEAFEVQPDAHTTVDVELNWLR